MLFRWVDPKAIRSFAYPTEAAARKAAIFQARLRGGVPEARARKALDQDLEEILWKSMRDVGWKIEVDA